MKKFYFLNILLVLLFLVPAIVNGSEVGTDVRIGSNANSSTFPQVVYCVQQDKFLVVWSGNDSGKDQIFYSFQTETDVSGSPSTAVTLLSSSDSDSLRYSERPQIAYDESTGNAAVVWQESHAVGKDSVMMSVINTSTELEITKVLVAGNSTWNMTATVASDNNGNFLVAYYDASSLNITAKIYDSSGNQSGSDMTLGSVSGGYMLPYSIDIAYNLTDHHFLVTWADFNSNLFSRTVQTNGTLGTPNGYTTIAGVTNPAIAYNDSVNKFLIVFDSINGGLGGHLTDGVGNLTGTRFSFGTDTLQESEPDIFFNPDNKNFIVTWNTLTDGPGIWVQELYIGDCNYSTNTVKIDDATITAHAPAVAYGINSKNYWIAWFGAASVKDEIFLQRYNSDFRWVQAVCQDTTIYLDNNGEYTINISEIDSGSYAVCEIPTLSLDKYSLSCSDFPETTIELTATRSTGESSSCIANVTVMDTIFPEAVCRNTTVYLDEGGSGEITTDLIDNGSDDNCSVDLLELDKTIFACADTGINNIMLTISDISGNTSTCLSEVTVLDTVSPLAVCKDITVFLDETGEAAIDSSMVDNGSSDNCGIFTMSINNSLFDCSNLNGDKVILTVSDFSGNTSECVSIVTVSDTIFPEITCPGDQTVSRDENCQYVLPDFSGLASASDNCAVASITQTPAPGTVVETGTTQITLSASDGINSATCTFDLTVTGVEVEFTADQTNTCYESEIQFSDLSPDAKSWEWDFGDDSPVETSENPIHTYSNPGVYSVKLIITDEYGCTDSITKTDFITINPPKAALNANPVRGCTLPHTVFFTDRSILPDTWYWEFGDGSHSTAQNPIHTYTEFGTFNVVLTVTDSIAGCSDTASIEIIVEDNEPPVITCPADTLVYADNNCQGTLPDYTSLAVATDLCDPIPVVTQVPAAGTLFSDSTEITLIATDSQDNASSCTFWVSVEDTVPPEALCQPVAVYLDEYGDASITAEQIDSGSNDACGIFSSELDITEFGCVDVGENTVVLMVTDLNGNSSSCVASVTVIDTVSPLAECKNIEVILDETGNALISEDSINNGSSDACGGLTFDTDITSFGCSDVGDKTLVLTITDKNGNSSTCDAVVTVEDITPPEIICNPLEIILHKNGEYVLAPNEIGSMAKGTTDACTSFDEMEIDVFPHTFECIDAGTNVRVVVSATDKSGNTSTCQTHVSVLDTVSPEATCEDITIALDENGEALIFPGQINAGSNDSSLPDWARTLSGLNSGSYDACGVDLASVSQQQFDCSDLGDNLVTLTVGDPSGNTSTCTSIVTVTDTIAPEIESVVNIELNLEPGKCSTEISYPELMVTDNCEVTLTQLGGVGPNGEFLLGQTTEKWIAQDAAGNLSDTVTFSVLVAAVNAPPTFSDITDIEVVEDAVEVITNVLGISDGGDCVGQELQVSAEVTTGIEIITLDTVIYTAGSDSAKLLLTPVSNKNGEATVSVTVAEKEGETITKTFKVKVVPENDAPFRITEIADQQLNASYQLKIPLSPVPGEYFDDIDGDTLELSVVPEGGNPLPEWITVMGDTLYANPSIADTGCITLVVEASDGEAAATDTFEICVEGYPTSINDLGVGQFEVILYPNPTRGKVNVDIESSHASEIQLTVMDITGRLVLNKQYKAADKILFDMSNEVSGMYFVQLDFEGIQIVKKLIVDRK